MFENHISFNLFSANLKTSDATLEQIVLFDRATRVFAQLPPSVRKCAN